MIRQLKAALSLVALVSLPVAVSAATVSDPQGDFLATYTGPQNADLDVISASAQYTNDYLFLSSTMNGAIGTTNGSLFLWGVNRGSGTDRLITSGPPAVGTPTILLDSVVRFEANGTGRVVNFPAMGVPVTTLLDPSLITISGNTISGRIPWALLPTTGFDRADYTFINWSRSALGSQQFIADLAPGDRSFTANAVPEPASWAMLIAGFGLVGSVARGRRALDSTQLQSENQA